MAAKDIPAPVTTGIELGDYLKPTAASTPQDKAVADTVMALAAAATSISRLVAEGPLAVTLGTVTLGADTLGADVGSANADGDSQKTLDVLANTLVLEALKTTSTAYYASEEEEAVLSLKRDGLLAVAVDPLDGSSNIDVNVSIGTIISIYPASREGAMASFFRPGREQLAAAYFIYGPHTALVLSLGHGVDLFVLDLSSQKFRLARTGLTIPASTKEYAINASNYRHWFPPVQIFIEDCLAGLEGPRGKDFNMRWVASLVAETHRIFSRGGVFLYPGDNRKGYAKGRLRLIYEANPIAMLAEQAGGGASNGYQRILDLVPGELHQRTPLIFGSIEKVERIASYHTDESFSKQHSPLFGQRGLFRR